MDYDVIGDIHGHAEKLESLLGKLGYVVRNGAYRHPSRHAAFVGDFIDRGRQGLETTRIVRAMVDSGSACAVMGNHEFNAIAWHTPDPRAVGEYLRRRATEPWGSRNRHQHAAFLAQVEHDPLLHEELVNWFLTLPLWLDLPEIRLVHACWHEPLMTWLAPQLRDGRFLTRDMLVDACTEPATLAEKDGPAPSVFTAVEVLTKGIELQLPDTSAFVDKDGISRSRVRSRWWDAGARTYRELANMADHEREQVPEVVAPEHLRPVSSSQIPVFFGHYWMTGEPRLLSAQAVCVDYSAGKGGPLVAYRHEAGAPLSKENFVCTD